MTLFCLLLFLGVAADTMFKVHSLVMVASQTVQCCSYHQPPLESFAPKMQNSKNAKNQKCKNSKMQKFKNAKKWLPARQYSGPITSTNSSHHCWKASHQKCRTPKMQKIKNAKPSKNAELQKCRNPKMQNSKNAKIHNSKKSKCSPICVLYP